MHLLKFCVVEVLFASLVSLRKQYKLIKGVRIMFLLNQSQKVMAVIFKAVRLLLPSFVLVLPTQTQNTILNRHDH